MVERKLLRRKNRFREKRKSVCEQLKLPENPTDSVEADRRDWKTPKTCWSVKPRRKRSFTPVPNRAFFPVGGIRLPFKFLVSTFWFLVSTFWILLSGFYCLVSAF